MSGRLIMVGGGAFGREVLDWARNSAASRSVNEIGFVLDANADALAGYGDLGLVHLGDPASFNVEFGDAFIMAIGDPAAKASLAATLSAQGAEFMNVVHGSAVVASTAHLARGIVIGPNSYIATHAVLEEFVCVNSLTGIGHDANVGAFSTVSSQVDITGKVIVGERVFIGSGARILPEVQIGAGARIGAGAVIVRNVKPNTSMYAAPARKI